MLHSEDYIDRREELNNLRFDAILEMNDVGARHRRTSEPSDNSILSAALFGPTKISSQQTETTKSASTLPYYDTIAVTVNAGSYCVTTRTSGRMKCAEFIQKTAKKVYNSSLDEKLTDEHKQYPFGIWMEISQQWMDENRVLNDYADLLNGTRQGRPTEKLEVRRRRPREHCRSIK